MQVMGLRQPQETRKVRAVRLGTAIKEALGPRSYGWLGEKVKLHETQIGRIINGQVKEISMERVRDIEAALGLPQGDLFRAAGYVPSDPLYLEQVISADTRLGLNERSALLQFLEHLVAKRLGRPELLAADAQPGAKPKRGRRVTRPQPPG